MPHENIDMPQFYVEDVARALNVKPATLRAWVRGALVMGLHDLVSHRQGRATVFTLRRCYQAALVAELTRFGFGIEDSGVYAACFSDGDLGKPDRADFGALYPDARTMMFVPAAGEPPPLIFPVTENTTLLAALGAVPAAGVLLNVSDIIGRLRRGLGYAE